jgi:hypothetical protein
MMARASRRRSRWRSALFDDKITHVEDLEAIRSYGSREAPRHRRGRARRS